MAPGSHPSQSIRCLKAAPGVTFQASSDVVVGSSGATDNCLSVGGSYIKIVGAKTRVIDSRRQCGIAVNRGSHHITLQNVDAGQFWIAADDVSLIGGDYGPAVDKVSKFSDRTCSATNGSCMPKRPLIDGAYIHDFRRASSHMECLAFYGGTDAIIRNTHFHNCSVFHIFISLSQAVDFRNILIENNRFSCGDQAVSNAVKFSAHGFRYSNAVMRNNRFDCQETYVASTTASQLLYEGNTGGGLHLNNGGSKADGAYSQGSTRVTVRRAAGTSPPPPPPPPPPSGNLAPSACFQRTPAPSSAGQTVTFDAACSTDPENDALSYAWDISPGGDGVYERSGPTASYAYTAAGTKTARLRVTDAAGNSTVSAQTFSVNP